MTISLLGSLTGALLGWLMGFLSLFLILLILIQRGKGGGLTGALGGPGGQSAFGSKAGDTFTVITIVFASFWGLTCAFTMWKLGTRTPTAVTETNISAGPGDDAETSARDDLFTPPDGSGGLGGIGGLENLDLGIGGDQDAAGPITETPSMDLEPADRSPSTDSPGATETPEATESTDSDASPAESTDDQPAGEEPAGDASAEDTNQQ